MTEMSPGRISATPDPAARVMVEAVDLAPRLRRDRVAVHPEENEVPLGEIAPAFESTVSRVHVPASAIWL
jgi:hypothetical protein